MNWVKLLKNFLTTMIFLKKNFKMKKIELLQNKLVVIFKEIFFCLPLFEKTQKDFDAHKISCKDFFLLLMKMRFLL